MEKKTTIVLNKNIVNELCKRKTKIGDTYNTVINDLLNAYKKSRNNEKI